ncbi:MAG: thymidine phosphorylase [Elusimicrobia bacterium]|nr:thymidine phosphorylase [Elusimicrobiota bacterium]
MRFLDLIAKKRDGGRHAPEELAFVAEAAARGLVPDYQLSAWLMAALCRGLDDAETAALAAAMAGSGERLGLGGLDRPKVDKHSTGGVGDGVSLALAPLVAACGAAVPMMSGRGLGHTGGTLDKLEAIPGLRVRLAPAAVREQMRRLGVCFFGQTETLAPADRALYALRDATATVPARGLVVSSILSKKAAEELDALVLDVKVGSGAIFSDAASARALARALVKTARGLGMRAVAVLTAMDQPLGRCVGDALEVRQAVEVLRGGEAPADYLECLLALAGWMLALAGKAASPARGRELASARLRDGSALRAFREVVKAQGGDPAVVDDPGRLPASRLSRVVPAPRDGWVARLDARRVGEAAVLLGAGRADREQAVDHGAGIALRAKVGERARRGGSLAVLYASDAARLDAGEAAFREALSIGPKPPRRGRVILGVVK